MANNDNFFINADGKKLFKRLWYPPSSDKDFRALIFIIHGLSEHSSFLYEETLAKPFMDCNCVVATHDHLGHGRSEGDRDILAPIHVLCRDVISHITQMIPEITKNNTRGNRQASLPPIFLYGHSLGGLVAVHIATNLQNEGKLSSVSFTLSGLMLEAPALDLNKGFSFLSEMMGRGLLMVWPRFVIRKPSFENLSTDHKIIDAASSDELRNTRGLSLGTALCLSDSISKIRPQISKMKVPFITAHGKLDPIVPVRASEFLYNETKLIDHDKKMIILYEEAKHILRASDDEIGRDFRLKVLDWLKKITE